MALALRVLLTTQGMISQSVVEYDIPANSRMECSHLCLQDKSCASFFYDDINNGCFLADELQNVTSMDPALPNMNYYEMHSDHCNNGYTFNRGLDLCYKVFSTRISWHSARSNCDDDGAHLIRVESDHVNNLMFQHAKRADTSLWTDGRENTDGFLWQDGSNMSKSYWALNEPTTVNECIVINVNENVASTSWHDLGCNALDGYVCQKDMDATRC